MFRDALNGLIGLLNKIAEFEKIAGRIAAYGKFRKNDKVDPLLLCGFDGRDHFVPVLFKVPDMVILLRKFY